MRRSFILCAFFISTLLVADTAFVLVNESIISEKVSTKVQSIGSELFEKTGIGVYVALPKSLEKQTIHEYEKELVKTLKKPFVLLTLVKEQKQVNIVHSEGLGEMFDRDGVLSPFPWSGTIIPVLMGNKKDNDNHNAAVLNGYADIAEQIASHKNIVLDNALGNTNKNIYFYLKVIIYGFLLFVFARYFYKKVRKKSE